MDDRHKSHHSRSGVSLYQEHILMTSIPNSVPMAIPTFEFSSSGTFWLKLVPFVQLTSSIQKLPDISPLTANNLRRRLSWGKLRSVLRLQEGPAQNHATWLTSRAASLQALGVLRPSSGQTDRKWTKFTSNLPLWSSSNAKVDLCWQIYLTIANGCCRCLRSL